MSSLLLLYSLPQVPDGVNPYAYYSAFAKSVVYRQVPDSRGFKIRLVVLFCLLGYLILGAAAYLVLAVVDSRRRKKELFLWKLVRRKKGRYIVGNQQLLEPILTIVTGSILLVHVVEEWKWALQSGNYATMWALRVATWSLLFLQMWIVSWASLQSFVITACDSSRALRWFSPWVANSLFLGLGGGLVIVLAVALGYSANVSYLLFAGYKDLQVLLYAAMPVYPAPVDAATSAGVALEWSEFLERATDCLKLTRITVIEFATSAAVTALANLGGIALLILVRRQIKANYSNFVGAGTHPSFQLPALSANNGERQSSDFEEAVAPAEPSSSKEVETPIAAGEGGGVKLSVTPATPLIPEAEEGGRALQDSTAFFDSPGSSRRSSLSGSGSNPMSRSTSQERKRKKSPSRAAVRSMARNETGGIAAAQAVNLARLHRVETDLFITCCSTVSTSFAFTALSSWVYTILPHALTLSWGEVEVAVLLGTWIYTLIHSIALTAHLYTSWQNLSRPSSSLPTSRNPTALLPSAYASPTTSISNPDGGPATHSLASALRLEEPTAKELKRLRKQREKDGGGFVDPTWLSPVGEGFGRVGEGSRDAEERRKEPDYEKLDLGPVL